MPAVTKIDLGNMKIMPSSLEKFTAGLKTLLNRPPGVAHKNAEYRSRRFDVWTNYQGPAKPKIKNGACEKHFSDRVKLCVRSGRKNIVLIGRKHCQSQSVFLGANLYSLG